MVSLVHGHELSTAILAEFPAAPPPPTNIPIGAMDLAFARVKRKLGKMKPTIPSPLNPYGAVHIAAAILQSGLHKERDLSTNKFSTHHSSINRIESSLVAAPVPEAPRLHRLDACIPDVKHDDRDDSFPHAEPTKTLSENSPTIMGRFHRVRAKINLAKFTRKTSKTTKSAKLVLSQSDLIDKELTRLQAADLLSSQNLRVCYDLETGEFVGLAQAHSVTGNVVVLNMFTNTSAARTESELSLLNHLSTPEVLTLGSEPSSYGSNWIPGIQDCMAGNLVIPRSRVEGHFNDLNDANNYHEANTSYVSFDFELTLDAAQPAPKENCVVVEPSEEELSAEVLEELQALGLPAYDATLFNVLETIGNGGQGCVYAAIPQDPEMAKVSRCVALKQVFLNGPSFCKLLINEITIMSEISHPNIVAFLNAYTVNSESAVVVMEQVKGADLWDVIQNNVTISEGQTAVICQQVCLALDYLHSKNIMHRDIKSQNIMLDCHGNVKLIDMGLCVQLAGANDTRSDFAGTVGWMAPEIAKQQPYGPKVDIWALGITIYEMVMGCQPYEDLSKEEALEALQAAPSLPDPQYASLLLRGFLERCLQIDANTRATPAQLLMHSFLWTGYTKDSLPRLLGFLPQRMSGN